MASTPTLDEVRTWGATCSVVAAGRSLGMSRNTAYSAIKAGTFPVRVIHIGGRYRVATAELVALLDAPAQNASTA